MFADRAKIFIKSGKGGDGHVSFRRELFVPDGGPDGGDGGKGGDIIFQVDKGLNTLTDFRHVRKYVAKDGEQGGKRRCHGANGADLVIKVPEGTVIKDAETGKVITDMSGDNMREVVLKGGRGGQGNMHYATATMQAPKYAQPGKPGQELYVNLELKVIADVGLVGFPCNECESEDRELPLHYDPSESRRGGSGRRSGLRDGGYPRSDRRCGGRRWPRS